MRKRDDNKPISPNSPVVVRTVSNSATSSSFASAACIVLIAIVVAYLLHTHPASPIASSASEGIQAAAERTISSSSSSVTHNNTIGSFHSSEQNTTTNTPPTQYNNEHTTASNMNGNGNGNGTSLHASSLKKACFAGGCFWGLELALQRVAGVENTTVGYIGGKTTKPSYEQICSGTTNHAEAVLVEFDDTVVPYQSLLDVFFTSHDSTTLNRQKGDVGTQYRSAIFCYSQQQFDEATAKVKSTPRATTQVAFAQSNETANISEGGEKHTFWPAEGYHQQYLEKGGRFGRKQSAKKGCTDPIRCYG